MKERAFTTRDNGLLFFVPAEKNGVLLYSSESSFYSLYRAITAGDHGGSFETVLNGNVAVPLLQVSAAIGRNNCLNRGRSLTSGSQVWRSLVASEVTSNDHLLDEKQQLLHCAERLVCWRFQWPMGLVDSNRWEVLLLWLIRLQRSSVSSFFLWKMCILPPEILFMDRWSFYLSTKVLSLIHWFCIIVASYLANILLQRS